MTLSILHIINSLEYGGAETRVVSLVRWLADRGHTVEIVTLKKQGELLDSLEPHAVKVRQIGIRSKWELPFSIGWLTCFLRQTPFDVVHCHLVYSSIAARAAIQLSKLCYNSHATPVLITTQHHAFHPKENTLLYRIEKCTRYQTDGMVALSSTISNLLTRDSYKGHLRIIPTGINSKEMTLEGQITNTNDSEYILSVGHMRDDHKGHDVLLRAFSLLAIQNPNLQLVLIGDGSQRKNLEDLALRLGIRRRVQFLGNLTRREIATWMCRCVIFALASRWEGFGRVLIEAMASGSPVVSTTVEAIPEVVDDGRTGLLVPPDQPELLARALGWLLSHPEERHRLAQSGAHMAHSRFSLDSMGQSTLQFYEYLLDSRRRESH